MKWRVQKYILFWWLNDSIWTKLFANIRKVWSVCCFVTWNSRLFNIQTCLSIASNVPLTCQRFINGNNVKFNHGTTINKTQKDSSVYIVVFYCNTFCLTEQKINSTNLLQDKRCTHKHLSVTRINYSTFYRQSSYMTFEIKCCHFFWLFLSLFFAWTKLAKTNIK